MVTRYTLSCMTFYNKIMKNSRYNSLLKSDHVPDELRGDSETNQAKNWSHTFYFMLHELRV